MRRLLTFAAIAATAGLGAWLAPSNGATAARSSASRTVTLRVGDRMKVLDAPIGCRVAQLNQFDGRIAVDCRRAGALAGTYGTLITSREAALARFESRRTARLLVVASHEGGVRQCGSRR